MNVLLIDSDKVDRVLLTRALQESDLHLTSMLNVETLIAGFESLETMAFDVVLCNFDAAFDYGARCIKTFSDHQPFSVAVVLLSTTTSEAQVRWSAQSGAHGLLCKTNLTTPKVERVIQLAVERIQLQQEVRKGQVELQRAVQEDSLTGLGNRYLFDKLLTNLVEQAPRYSQTFALLILDLDHFKDVNDTLGHEVGDRLLKSVATRLMAIKGEGNELCRLGGDEFAFLLRDVSSQSSIRYKVHEVFQILQTPFDIDTASMTVTVSIGIAKYPESADNANELMQCADVAMYRSKALGLNQFHFYSKDIHFSLQRRVTLERDLPFAIERGQLQLYYQPQLRAVDMSLCGAEALIRWLHPEFGLLGPDEFIPIAESVGIIQDLGRWAIKNAIAQYSDWRVCFPLESRDFTIATNLSAREMREPGFVDYIRSLLRGYQVPARFLEIELTESCLDVSEAAIRFLKSIDQLGIRISLDDFGTGYSNLSHLLDFPIRVVKLDKSFLRDTSEEDRKKFLQALSLFAHSLNYETVAEGIETADHKQLCIDLGVSRLQGYLFARPLTPEQLASQWLCLLEAH